MEAVANMICLSYLENLKAQLRYEIMDSSPLTKQAPKSSCHNIFAHLKDDARCCFCCKLMQEPLENSISQKLKNRFLLRHWLYSKTDTPYEWYLMPPGLLSGQTNQCAIMCGTICREIWAYSVLGVFGSITISQPNLPGCEDSVR